MSNIDDIYSGDTLKASDIQGREPTVTIKSVEPRDFKNNDGRVQKKLVISFHGAQKKFVCNKTNANRIAFMHGKDFAGWPGKKITLFVDPFVEFGGEIKSAIRVKPPAGAAAPAPAPAPQAHDELDPPPLGADMNDEIPF